MPSFSYRVLENLKFLLTYFTDMSSFVVICGRPLFASSLLSLIHILLDQTRHDDIRILGCQALFDFVNNQVWVVYFFQKNIVLFHFYFKKFIIGYNHSSLRFHILPVENPLLIEHLLIVQRDGTYVFNLDGLVPKLCHLAQEMGEDGKVENLRTAGLQALSSMVFYLMAVKLNYHVIFFHISSCYNCFRSPKMVLYTFEF